MQRLTSFDVLVLCLHVAVLLGAPCCAAVDSRVNNHASLFAAQSLQQTAPDSNSAAPSPASPLANLSAVMVTDANGNLIPLSIQLFLTPQPSTSRRRMLSVKVPKADLADPFREKKHKVAVLRQRLDMVVTEMQRLKLMKKDQENAIWQAYSLLINQHRNFTAAYDHYKRAKANVHSTLSAHDIELVHVTMQQEAAKLNEYVHFHHKLLHKWQAVVVMVMDQILNMERHKFRLEREISILQSHMSQLPFVPPPLTSLVTSSQQS